MKKQSILVVGGAGFIGSHVTKMLLNSGYETIVLDNLSSGSRKAVTGSNFIQGDLGDPLLLDSLFKTKSISAVMHFAAFIDVGESTQQPSKYYQNNVCQTVNLLDAMISHNVKKFIFSSSAAVYGPPSEIPIKETHPCRPINPYGESKLTVEKMLRDFDAAYGLKYAALRYFNAAGGDPEGVIKNFKKKESNLIPVALRSLMDNLSALTIYGTDYETKDGTCIRDYVHVHDLGVAHISAMENLFNGASSGIYNLGNEQGFSVLDVISEIEKVTGKKIQVQEGVRRPGDPPFLIADAGKAKKMLNWAPKYTELSTIIEHAWKAL